MTGAQFIAKVYQILGIPAAHPEVTNTVIADNYCARVDELTLLVTPPTMRKTARLNVVANSATIYLPIDHLQTIKVRQSDSAGNWGDLELQTEEDADQLVSVDTDSASVNISGIYSYAGIVTDTGSSDYGKLILKLGTTPTVSVASGLQVRYWQRATDLITGTNSQYQIVQVPRGYQVGLAHGVAGLIAIDPRLNRDPITYLQVWQDTVQRYQHFGPEHRLYDYRATGYSSIASHQETFWGNQ